MRTWPALEVTFNGGAPDLLQAALLDYPVAAVDDTSASDWRIFFQTATDRETAASELPQQFPELSFQSIDVPDENWAARSQAALRAVRVGDIVVAPPWDVAPTSRLKPAPTPAPTIAGNPTDVGAGFSRLITIVIQPSMGFGTGHHATTRLCLAALQQLDLHGRSVIDVGTGSGVLAIAASRLGASSVLAVDDDPDATQSAEENLVLNPGTNVVLRTVDLRLAPLPPHDVVTANLTGGLLIQAAGRLRDLTAATGHLILSGFMKAEEAGVRAAYSGLAIRAREEEDEWLCVTLQRV